MRDIVKQIASQVRSACEGFVNSHESFDYDFHGQDDLCCMCAVASMALKKALEREGIHSDLVVGEYDGFCHCWLEWQNYIVDITATQFNLKRKIHIVSTNTKLYNKIEVNPSEFKDWPHTQKPNDKVVKYILERI